MYLNVDYKQVISIELCDQYDIQLNTADEIAEAKTTARLFHSINSTNWLLLFDEPMRLYIYTLDYNISHRL